MILEEVDFFCDICIIVGSLLYWLDLYDLMEKVGEGVFFLYDGSWSGFCFWVILGWKGVVLYFFLLFNIMEICLCLFWVLFWIIECLSLGFDML